MNSPPYKLSDWRIIRTAEALGRDNRFWSVIPYAIGEILQKKPDIFYFPSISSFNFGRHITGTYYRYYISGAIGLFFWCTILNVVLDPEQKNDKTNTVTIVGLIGLIVMELIDCQFQLHNIDAMDCLFGSLALLIFNISFNTKE